MSQVEQLPQTLYRLYEEEEVVIFPKWLHSKTHATITAGMMVLIVASVNSGGLGRKPLFGAQVFTGLLLAALIARLVAQRTAPNEAPLLNPTIWCGVLCAVNIMMAVNINEAEDDLSRIAKQRANIFVTFFVDVVIGMVHGLQPVQLRTLLLVAAACSVLLGAGYVQMFVATLQVVVFLLFALRVTASAMGFALAQAYIEYCMRPEYMRCDRATLPAQQPMLVATEAVAEVQPTLSISEGSRTVYMSSTVAGPTHGTETSAAASVPCISNPSASVPIPPTCTPSTWHCVPLRHGRGGVMPIGNLIDRSEDQAANGVARGFASLPLAASLLSACHFPSPAPTPPSSLPERHEQTMEDYSHHTHEQCPHTHEEAMGDYSHHTHEQCHDTHEQAMEDYHAIQKSRAPTRLSMSEKPSAEPSVPSSWGSYGQSWEADWQRRREAEIADELRADVVEGY